MKKIFIKPSTQAEELTKELPALLTQEQAAKFFQVTTRTIRRWNRSGRLPSYRTTPTGSGRVLISKVEVAKFLDRMLVPRPFEVG